MTPSTPLLPGRFTRGLAPAFAAALGGGDLEPLAEAVRELALDLEVRDDYINVYSGRCSVLKLSHQPRRQGYCARVHRKYAPPAGFALKGGADYAEQLVPFAAARGWAVSFGAALRALGASSKPFDKPEGGAEFHLMQENREPPFLALDRQLQLGQVRGSRVDVLGVRSEGAAEAVVLIELKQGRRLQTTAVLEQIERYEHLYVQGGRLRGDVADALDGVLRLKRKLRLVRGGPSRPLRELPVELLVVLATRDAAPPPPPTPVKGQGLVHYVGRTQTDLRLPPRAAWQLLRAP